jgi:hypothetical protein
VPDQLTQINCLFLNVINLFSDFFHRLFIRLAELTGESCSENRMHSGLSMSCESEPARDSGLPGETYVEVDGLIASRLAPTEGGGVCQIAKSP